MEEYPLERAWAVWYNGRAKRPPPRPGRPPPRGDEFTTPTRVGSFDTVSSLWRYMNNIAPPSELKQDVNLFIFQGATEPQWEHPDNKSGGRWTFSVDNSNAAAADTAWTVVYLALVGETLDPGFEIVGVTASRRRHYIRISVWTKDRKNDSAVLEIGHTLKRILAVPLGPGLKIEYQDHGAAFESYRHTLA